MSAALVEATDVVVAYPAARTRLFQRKHLDVPAVDGVSVRVEVGETLAVVGESGSGKSTLGKAILGLVDLAGGEVLLGGRSLGELPAGEQKVARRRFQIVFQDSAASLDPRKPVGRLVTEPLDVQGLPLAGKRDDVAAGLLAQVGLGPDMVGRRPHQLSGGQKQRVAIARALSLEPSFIVADEPVSALDVSVQAQIANLLLDLQRERGIAFLCISHDLALMGQISDRVAVMYLGKVVETGPTADVFAAPKHPYTVALLAAVPSVGAREPSTEIVLHGDPPSRATRPRGCRFASRCWLRAELGSPERCTAEEPELVAGAACHFSSTLLDRMETTHEP